MKKYLLFLVNFIIISSLFINKAAFADNTTITVAAAANVKFAINDLKEEFKKESGIEIKAVTSSSGKLTAQIRHGAPFDIFMSADMDFPRKLYSEGFAVTKPIIYAYGTLVLWTMKDFDLSEGFKLLSSSKIGKIAIANPKVAPYGEQAINSLNHYKIYEQVKDKFVYGESISDISSYIFLKAVDIGFTAKSVVLSDEMKDKGKWIEIDKKAYNPIAQGVVILKYGKENNYEASKKFYDFLFSKKARKIFEKYGYIVKK